MSKKNDLKSELMSKIDPQLLDRMTARRAKFLIAAQRRKEIIAKRVVPIIASAACLCLVMTILFVFIFGGGIGGKQIPIYRGMTVSTTSPIASAKADGILGLFSLENSIYRTLDNSDNPPNLEGNEGNHNGQNKQTEATELPTEEPTVAPWDPNASGTKPLFYANKGEDFYITVHIDNPDNFEIVSFTLNGKKYSSYMFEEGSDMENLVLKCNAGEAVNIVEYTIDAIKYIDGTEIKDVKIGGEQTIKVGLYSEGIQPKATVSNEAISYDSVSFSANIADEYDRIADSEGLLTARLYKGEELIASKEISAKEDVELVFDSLTPNTVYKYVIVADYDSLDGSGKKEYVLHEKEFKTDPILTADTVDVSYHTAGLNFAWHSLASENSITAIELYLGEEKVRDIDVSATEIDGLLSNNEYTVKISYTDKGIDYHHEITFKTSEYSAVIELGEAASEYHEFVFEINETDEFELGSISAIELYLGEELVKSLEDLTLRRFDELLADNTYTLKVTYKYNLKDGKGEQTEIQSIEIKTNAYTAPNISFEDISSDKTEISFGINVNDPDQMGAIEKIELYLGDTLVKTAASNDVREFNSLDFLKVYTVKVTYVYDMKDGKGEQKIEINTSISTQTAGLAIADGVVTGIGTCTETEIYINMPIAQNAFANNQSITAIHLGENSSIGVGAFKSCASLEKIDIHDNITHIPEEAFMNCENLKSVVFPAKLISIKDQAFRKCESLTEITLPDKLEVLENSAFEGCTELKKVNISANAALDCIGERAFYECYSLECITIPNNVTEILGHAFSGCESLTEIIFSSPDSLEKLGSGAFYGCENLTKITLSKKITSIDSYTFDSCTSLTEIAIPDSVTIIGEGAFQSCISLEKVLISENSNIKKIEAHAFAFCEKLTNIYLPPKLTHIYDYTFSNCKNLENIIIPDGVTSIGMDAFNSCTSLKSINIPESVTSIGDYAFYGSLEGEIAYIPDSVKSIGENAFSFCTLCVENAQKPTRWNNNWANMCDVIWSVKECYTDSDGWSCATTDNDKYLVKYSGNKISITVPNDITVICSQAFEKGKVETVIIPSSVKTIYTGAFDYAYHIKTIFISHGVETVGALSIFSDICDNNPTVYIGYKVTEIPDGWSGWYGPLEDKNFVYNVKSITVDAEGNVTEVIYNS